MKKLILALAAAAALSAQTCLVYAPQMWTDGEQPTGAKDGKNRAFTLSRTPVPGSAPLVVLNGLVLRLGATADYTLAGATITFTPKAAIPQSATENLLVWYRWQP